MRSGPLIATAGLAALAIVTVAGIPQAGAVPAGSRTRRHIAPGSKLGSIQAQASAYGYRQPFYSHQGEDVEAESPFSLVSLGIGGVGNALTSIFWPGDTGAYGGEVLDLLGVNQIPESIKKQLNDPEKAEAQTGVGPKTVRDNGAGFSQVATATPFDVTANTHAGGSAVPTAGQYSGQTIAVASAKITGSKTVTVTAQSSVHNFSLAGVLTISNIRTTADAITRATTATARTATVITGAKVAGVPVTIDGSGVHVKGHGSAIPLVNPDQVVNQALAKSGIKISTTPATKTVKGATATVTSGALQIQFTNGNYTSSDNDTGDLLIVGGVALSAASSPGYPVAQVSPSIQPTTPSTSAPSATTPPVAVRNQRSPAVGAGVPPASGGGVGPGSAPEVAPSTSPLPLKQASDITLATGLKLWWVVGLMLLSGLVAFALRRLPDRIDATLAETCTLEKP